VRSQAAAERREGFVAGDLADFFAGRGMEHLLSRSV
jgi:hypothetical protein